MTIDDNGLKLKNADAVTLYLQLPPILSAIK